MATDPFAELLIRLRRNAGRTQEQQADAINAASGRETVTRREITRYENFKTIPTNHTLVYIAMACDISPDYLQREAAAARARRKQGAHHEEKNQDGTKRHTLREGAVVAAVAAEPHWDSPVDITSALDGLLASNTASAALQTSDDILLRIIEEYESDGPTGPSRLAAETGRLRFRLHKLLQGRQPPSHRTELFRIASRASAVLGYMAVNAGLHSLATAYCNEAVAMATDIGDLETVMWAHGTLSLSAYYRGNFRDAVRWASAGIALAPDHPQAIRLQVNGLARALARQGDRPGTLTAISAAEDLTARHDVSTALTPCISLEPYGLPRTLANAITGHVALGDTADVLRYESEISGHVATSDSDWTRSLVALDVATVLVSGRHTDIEHAMLLGRQVLDDAQQGPLILSVVQRAHALHRSAKSWAKTAAVREYGEALWAWSDAPRVRQLTESVTMPVLGDASGRT
ncbi:helix-turn-helix domain-containing protein [Streptomyces scabiei]|uniref:helix-turn-helix domain-containing protein n=1 Tax=Streptomyces scabiei TaxID=1930 RepID=UPI0029A09E10|nr:helix-turn-helix transcriptional regulator [Streptomyces scabiei]MDX2531550.1 helix-turn-helix transcriptional regulator [Streptomyces scabiei]MDX2796608.1 helix-turn-helix transcriptional regulator [Streptomyces scabiei]MDX2856862.1 helix-turn-helix transcriptional regulator [Streptomyces scabiei]MDX3824604.1 helix-turn-helix transcriptional regulator [Streptomyces scabiei]